jgi:hypothetical protein
MRRNALLSLALLLVLLLAAPSVGLAQQQTEGIDSGNYNIKHSAEFGYRWTDFTGNQDVFQTFVNLGQGPRLMGHTLEMRSLDHRGLLFDDFYLTNFGYGGDPENLSILRVNKNKWFNLNGSFRRYRNLWNYNLLANPLNPGTSNPTVPILFSPHAMRLSRRLSDFNLTLLPQSPVRFRLGYTRNINEGPSLTTFHEGTDVLVFQDWKNTLNAYQFGVDYKPSPRTNISYDQFFQYYKGDTSWIDQNFGFQLADGTPVDLGIIFDTANNAPCRVPLTDPTTTPPTVNPTCNGYLSYGRSSPTRTRFPTERLSFQTSAVKNLDLSGQLIYSSATSEVNNFDEFYQGLVTRTLQREFAVSGPATARRVNATGDLAATFMVTPKFRILEEFRFTHFRIPGQWNMSELSLFGTSLAAPPVIFDPATCPPPHTAPTCPPHSASSPADVISGTFSLFLGQNVKLNTIQAAYDFSRKLGARAGYRYRNRTVTLRRAEFEDLLYFPSRAVRGACTAGTPLNADGSCSVQTSESHAEETTINEHSFLLGLWSRPVREVRISFDMELLSADNTFTRISPRQFQRYKLRAAYRPSPGIMLGGSLNIYEARNNVTDINHLQHSRSYGFYTTVAPNDRWGADVGYDYNNIFSNTNICFAFTFTPVPPEFGTCPTLAPGFGSIAAVSTYNVTTDFAHAAFRFRPVPRLLLNLGYSMNSVSGETLILSPNAFPGPLQSSYSRPTASVEVDVAKGWTWHTGWGYYNYREQAYFGDLTAPRSFRGNLVSFSVRHSF